ncbi:NB-ARC domain-containing protein [Actinoplanes derwentensis]|uniref:NB-ARC domain-containing protein n=1 Tax=Actinoplanes derwentensis TaxID=113562 RepID=UPI001E30792A|nr:NB-ARC domain-containing protein [Actinoplanes derwentensis]
MIMTSVVMVLATALSGLAINVATNSPAEWFPSMNDHPLPWLAGSLVAILIAGLALWWAQASYAASLLTTVPVTQRPESWVIDRPQELAAVVRALTRRRAAATVGITTAVHGAGGFGKTTVARLVRANRHVLRRFGGRVYWVTLGRDARRGALVEKINDLVKQVDSARAQPFTDVRLAAEHLASVLADGPRRLIIVDDVWFEDQLDAFPVAGRCARLVTTRIPSLVAEAVPVKVDQMSDAQASRVLTAKLPQQLPQTIIDGLLEETGRWPLLLRLVNRIILDQARSRTDVADVARELLDQLRTDGPLQVDKLTGASVRQLDVNDPDQRDEAIRATIEASAGLLGTSEHARFAELAVFAEDETVPVTLITTLWAATGDLDPAGSRALCARLADLALLNLTATDAGGAITLHDVVRDFLAESLGKKALIELHHTLVDSARESLPAGPAPTGPGGPPVTAWWALPESSRYLRDHLVEHLLGASRQDEAEAVATDLRWVLSRLEETGPAGPAADLALIATERAAHVAGVFGRNAHLFGPTAAAHSCADILLDRVAHDPIWQAQTRRLAKRRSRPRLVSITPPPDLPDPALRRAFDTETILARDIVFGPEDDWVAVVDIWGTVRRLDRETGRRLPHRALSRETPGVSDTALSADGGTLAVARHAEGVVTISDPSTGRLLRRITDDAKRVAVSRDGSLLACAGSGKPITLWDLRAGRKVMTLAVDGEFVSDIAFCRDKTTIVVAGFDRVIRVVDIGTGREQTNFMTSGSVKGIAASADGTWVATIEDATTVNLWKVRTGERIGSLTDRTGSLEAVAVAESGTSLATAGVGGLVRIWDVAAALTQSSPVAVPDRRTRIIQKGTVLATHNFIGTVAVSGFDEDRMDTVDLGSEHFAVVDLTPDGSRLAVERTFSPGYVEIWNVAAGQREATILDVRQSTRSISIAPDGRRVAAPGRRGILVWDVETGRKRRFAPDSWGKRWLRSLAFSRNGSWIAAAGGAESYLWDLKTGRPILVLRSAGTWMSYIAFTPDDTRVVTCGDGKTHIWDAQSGRQIAVSKAPEWVESLAFSPNGRFVATVSDSRELWVSDIVSGRLLAVTRVDSTLQTCTWSPDGRHVLTSSDNTQYRFEFRNQPATKTQKVWPSGSA